MWSPSQWGPRGGEPNGQIVSTKRAADGRKQRDRKIIDEEREKRRVKNGSLRNTSTDSKRTTFVILINHASAPIRKERLNPTSKARRRKASRNEFVEKSGMPDRAENFREIGSRKDRPRSRPEFVIPIRNGLRKEQNLIECRPSRVKIGLAGRVNDRRDRKMHSGSFETQEVKEIGRKEAGESRDFPILWMKIIEDVFQMEGKEYKVSPRKIEDVKKKIHARARKVL